MEAVHDGEFDRRALLRKAAAAGAVGWTAPVILSRATASAAGVFTAKCAPGTVTASATFVQTGCTNTNSTITIRITFAGPCPCGGTKTWCAQKNTPAPVVSGTTTLLAFSVVIPIASTITITGKVAMGCFDRDGDAQYAVYNWSMTATDDGGACATTDSVTQPVLSGRTIVAQATCPPLAAPVVAAPVVSAPTGRTRRP